MSFVEVIASKRDGHPLNRRQISQFVHGASAGTLPPEQLAAMLMAICCRGMDEQETRWLTREMLESGEQWRLADDRPDVVDKHSTGGVGDSVSLVLAPLLAAVDCPIAMMAGHGLGHSQGTLDKLAAIPGFRYHWQRSEVLQLLDLCGAAVVAQTDRVAPADRVLYALRDVTGTVPSLPLIVASIMSKKLALGAEVLVLDVKRGRGAFRKTTEEAVQLASALRDVAVGMGAAAEALITDMNQPLGPALGTACEVRAALDVLGGGGSAELREVSVRLAREAMVLRGWQVDAAEQALVSALASGRARDAWVRIVEAHGGDPDPRRLPKPRESFEVASDTYGWVEGIAAEILGWVAVELGAGRRMRDDRLAHGAGIEMRVRIGDRVEPGQPLATIAVGERNVDLESASNRIRSAIEVGREPVAEPQLILGTVDEAGAL